MITNLNSILEALELIQDDRMFKNPQNPQNYTLKSYKGEDMDGLNRRVQEHFDNLEKTKPLGSFPMIKKVQGDKTVIQLGCPYLYEDEISVWNNTDHILVKGTPSLEEGEEHPFAKELQTKIPLKVLSDVKVEFIENYLEITITPKNTQNESNKIF